MTSVRGPSGAPVTAVTRANGCSLRAAQPEVYGSGWGWAACCCRKGCCRCSRQAGLDCFRGCAGAREHLGLPSSDSSLVVAPAYRARLAPLRGGSCERSRREGFLRPLRTRRCVGSTSSVRCRRGGSFERSREADLDPLRRRSAEQSRLGCLPRDSGESNALLPLATSRADRLKGCESPS